MIARVVRLWQPRIVLAAAFLAAVPTVRAEENLLPDPSFEETKERDKFGMVFRQWSGWKYDGDCSFEVGKVAHTGKTSCLLAGSSSPKIRVRANDRELAPGRYRITAFLRGLDIGAGAYRATTEFMFDGQYIPLAKNGTFGWTPLTYVVDVKEPKKVTGPSFGLMAPGLFWIDDVALQKVADDLPLTPKPVLGAEEAPIAPPGALGADAIRCALCGYRNQPAWQACYACGSALEVKAERVAGPPVKTIASFEEKNPFAGADATVTTEHATDGAKTLRLAKGMAVLDGLQDWTGYDFLKADVFAEGTDPVSITLELRDKASRDYWTRVNYVTVVPPGASTLTVPVRQLYVGEKSRPGRMLDLAGITRFVFARSDDGKAGPLYLDNVRLERDDTAAKALFDGLYAFDFGTSSSPVMDGFTAITPATLYSKGRGYGLYNARVWRAFDVLQPDPLYQDFVCIESGGLRLDVPNGDYHVFVNINSASGFWGEYQTYTERAILAQGQPVVTERMSFADQVRKYFRFWDTEDLPSENTFDKYQRTSFREQQFDVSVTDGTLDIGFQGQSWGCCVSALIVYPKAKAAEGARFLSFVENRRRFYFDNAFKRVLAQPTGAPLAPTATDQARGFVLFTRDPMQEVGYGDTPQADELCAKLSAQAFAGEYEPLTVALVPLRDLGPVTVTCDGLQGPNGTIPADAIDIGFVSYRVSRVTMDGAVYTIKPRLIMPTNTVACPAGVARRFWLTVQTPAAAAPGVYSGAVTLKTGSGATERVPVEFRVRAGTLDPPDLPVGPWGGSIGVPWVANDAAASALSAELTTKGLQRLRAYGFNTFTGVPEITYKGFQDGQPALDFARADAQMRQARELGFVAVVSYGSGVRGLNAYYQDAAALTASGLADYSAFVGAIYGTVQRHADEQGWLPVYYNLSDEPLGENLTRAAENAEAYRKAIPKGPPFFTGATSFSGTDPDDPHFRLSKALHVANWGNHSEESVKLLHDAGGNWAFYNGGNRWTFGDYLYKAAQQFGATFRLAWHWNAVAGDPYYALDCREDDYAWCNASPDGRLVPSLEFERVREGLDDYRRLITLQRLAKAKVGTSAANAAQKLIDDRMASFKLGQRDHDKLFPVADWSEFRAKVDDAIESLR